jgi:glucosamine kinase
MQILVQNRTMRVSPAPERHHWAAGTNGIAQMKQGKFFIGVDGGATRCRVRIRDEKGALVGSADGPAANVYIGRQAAIATLSSCLASALATAALGPSNYPQIRAVFGLAGVSTSAEADALIPHFPAFQSLAIVNDAVTACAGAHAGRDGGVVIAGTGMAGIARAGDETRIIAGRGFILGDEGSAAHIGLNGLRACLRAHDGIDEPSPLTQSLLEAFGGDPNRLTAWALTATPGDFGSFAPSVFAAAAAKDPVGCRLIDEAANAIGALSRAVMRIISPVALVGGLSDSIRPYLDPCLADALQAPRLDPVEGALLLAGGPLDPGLVTGDAP